MLSNQPPGYRGHKEYHYNLEKVLRTCNLDNLELQYLNEKKKRKLKRVFYPENVS